jgi:hypothetical protein
VAESAIEGRAQFDERQQGEGNEEAAAAPAEGAAPPAAQTVTPTEPAAASVVASAAETTPAEVVGVPTVEDSSDGSGEEGEDA